MKIKGIFIHPIKSCQRIALNEAEVTPKGFVLDREFMLVDENHKFMTQRQESQLATIQIKIVNNNLVLSVNSAEIEPFILTPSLTGEMLEVNVWRDNTMAIDQGDEVAQWFQTALQLPTGKTCRLVQQSPEYIRPVNPKYATQESDHVSFADGSPFLLTNTASLADLNQRIKVNYPEQHLEFPMIRFRPNLVIETEKPFIEDTWKRVKIGEIEFSIIKSCGRCIVITTDQTTGERNQFTEPLKTLSTFRQQSGRIMFGQNMVPQNTGYIRMNDTVKVLENQ
ncbi:MAG: MOSC N-terminal beta barrel domain-containing protein [Microcoleaceae cyanobacterium]